MSVVNMELKVIRLDVYSNHTVKFIVYLCGIKNTVSISDTIQPNLTVKVIVADQIIPSCRHSVTTAVGFVTMRVAFSCFLADMLLLTLMEICVVEPQSEDTEATEKDETEPVSGDFSQCFTAF